MTASNKLLPVPEVALSKEDPLSVDLKIFTEAPTATKVLFPKATPSRLFPVGEVALSKEDPLSVDLIIIPELPTTTNTPEPEEEEKLSEEVVSVVELSSVVVSSSTVVEVVEESLSLLLLQEMTVKLKRDMRSMSICLTWCPFGGLGKPKLYQNM